jgi:hypothetical protein
VTTSAAALNFCKGFEGSSTTVATVLQSGSALCDLPYVLRIAFFAPLLAIDDAGEPMARVVKPSFQTTS